MERNVMFILLIFWRVCFRTLIPKSFMGRFLGQQGANKKKIEDSTQCKIEIPERKKNAPVGLLYF
jgi:rRNA processing protein Krr1/Pno1